MTTRELYPWQRGEIRALSEKVRPRVAYVQVPRKNGKTYLAACLALAEVCLRHGRHVYAVSDSVSNLNSVLMREVRDIVGASPHLRDSIHIYQRGIEVPETGSFIEVRANNFRASQGINPHLVCFDEVHLQKNADIWSGMQMAGAARPDALLFGITTPGYDVTSLAHDLYLQVKAGDQGIYGRIFEADPAADIDDRDAWREANPCYGNPGFAEAMEYDRRTLPEHEFMRYRLGRWTAGETAWLPYGAWSGRAAPGVEVREGSRVWLGFDGSLGQDSTALVGVTEDLHVFVLGAWENPGRPGWRVPRDRVKEAVAEAFERFDVVEMLADPPYWWQELAEWQARWGERVVPFPTNSRTRMAPACTTFYSAVMEGRLTHDGDPRLARHVSNAIVKSSPDGDFITKADKMSPAKIDLAVAAVIALAAAARHQRAPRRSIFVL